jgi:hypothetical protein
MQHENDTATPISMANASGFNHHLNSNPRIIAEIFSCSILVVVEYAPRPYGAKRRESAALTKKIVGQLDKGHSGSPGRHLKSKAGVTATFFGLRHAICFHFTESIYG